MVDPAIEDLHALDREVALAATALSSWRNGLLLDWQAHSQENPFVGVRRAAGKSTMDALEALQPSAADRPLRDALSSWVKALVLGRTGMVGDIAWAHSAMTQNVRFEGEPPRQVNWLDAWRGLASASTIAEAQLWLRSAGDLAEPLAAVERTRAERSLEVARRLGLSHPWEAFVGEKRGDLSAAAFRLLARTDDLSRAVWQDALSGAGAAAVFHSSLARECADGWPARLSFSWLRDAFRGEPHDLTLNMPSFPQASGAATFARALEAFGSALASANAPRWLPFALAHEPGGLEGHRLGFVFGSLPSQPIFHTKVLRLSARLAQRQSRILARSALLHVRLHAARIILGADLSPSAKSLFEEITERLFGKPLNAALHPAWPAARPDEAARFVALLEARAVAEEMRDRYDADWFHNPRAWVHLQAPSPFGPRKPPSSEDDLLRAADGLAVTFEGWLG